MRLDSPLPRQRATSYSCMSIHLRGAQVVLCPNIDIIVRQVVDGIEFVGSRGYRLVRSGQTSSVRRWNA
jgi:hypothetical protein